MSRNNKKSNENYLERIPKRPDSIKWSSDEKGIVTLEIKNEGFVNKLAQKLLKKPKISYVHLDETGSFVWSVMDGKKTVADIAVDVKTKFGDDAEPLYERLAKYMQILDSYGFVSWNEK